MIKDSTKVIKRGAFRELAYCIAKSGVVSKGGLISALAFR